MVFSMCSLLARYAKAILTPRPDLSSAQKTQCLCDKITDYLHRREETSALDAIDVENNKTAVCALVAIATIYPCTFGLAEFMIPSWLSKAAPATLRTGGCLEAVMRDSLKNENGTPNGTKHTEALQQQYGTIIPPSIKGEWPLITPDDLEEGRAWWDRFIRQSNGAWHYGLGPMITHLIG